MKMTEYIEREAFLKDIEERYCLPCKVAGKDHNGCMCRACWVDDMCGEVIDAPAADVAPVGWTSVKDRLPKPETEVLAACVRNGYRFICPVIYENGTTLAQDSIWNWHELYNYGTYSEENDDYFVPEGWWETRQFTPDDVYNNPVDCAVTHWMPLPEPPEEVRGNE